MLRERKMLLTTVLPLHIDYFKLTTCCYAASFCLVHVQLHYGLNAVNHATAMGGRRGNTRLIKPLLLQSPPRHLHEVPPVDTKSVVGGKAQGKQPERSDDGGHRRQLRWCLIKNTDEGRELVNRPASKRP
mgnify:CR=1 FL=1